MNKLMILESNIKNGFGILIEGNNPKNFIPVERVPLLESVDHNDRYRIRFPFLSGDIKNGNGRVYPFESVLKPSCDRYIVDKVNCNRGGGELEHPADLNLNAERFCHKIVKIYYERPYCIGESLVGERGMGKFIRDMLDLNFVFGASSRGTGTLAETIVQPDYEIYYIDLVMDPSGKGCHINYSDYMRNVSESNLVETIGVSEQCANKLKSEIKQMRPITDKNFEEKVLKQMNEFIKKIADSYK